MPSVSCSPTRPQHTSGLLHPSRRDSNPITANVPNRLTSNGCIESDPAVGIYFCRRNLHAPGRFRYSTSVCHTRCTGPRKGPPSNQLDVSRAARGCARDPARLPASASVRRDQWRASRPENSVRYWALSAAIWTLPRGGGDIKPSDRILRTQLRPGGKLGRATRSELRTSKCGAAFLNRG